MAELAIKIGRRMAELRKERQREDPRWTQDYLARQIDSHLTSSQVSRYERGEVKPGDDRLERIAEILGTSVSDLYAGPVSERHAKTSDNGTGPLDELTQESEITRRLDEIEGLVRQSVAFAERNSEILALLAVAQDISPPADPPQEDLPEALGGTGQ